MWDDFEFNAIDGEIIGRPTTYCPVCGHRAIITGPHPSHYVGGLRSATVERVLRMSPRERERWKATFIDENAASESDFSDAILTALATILPPAEHARLIESSTTRARLRDPVFRVALVALVFQILTYLESDEAARTVDELTALVSKLIRLLA